MDPSAQGSVLPMGGWAQVLRGLSDAHQDVETPSDQYLYASFWRKGHIFAASLSSL